MFTSDYDQPTHINVGVGLLDYVNNDSSNLKDQTVNHIAYHAMEHNVKLIVTINKLRNSYIVKDHGVANAAIATPWILQLVVPSY